MTAVSFHAADVSWQASAQCQGSDFEFTPDVEDAPGLEAARAAFCNFCEVRVECLMYALLYNAQGYWGGTSTAERRKLGKRRDRAKCPSCDCKAVIHTEGQEICQSCALSWSGTPPARLPEGAVG